MLPTIELWGFSISGYGLMIFIGVLCGAVAFYFLYGKPEGLRAKAYAKILGCAAISGLALFLGASAFDTLFHSLKEGRFTLGGITWLGGVVVGFPTMVFLLNRAFPSAKGRGLSLFSMLVPAIVLAHGFGRIGCFLGGCCYGMETDSFLGVTFPGHDHAVLPTQLFEAAFEFLLFGVLAFTRKKSKHHGLEIYFIAYGVFRFFNEFLRGDDRGGTLSLLTPAQFLDIILVLCGICVILYQKGLFLRVFRSRAFFRVNAAYNGVMIPADLPYGQGIFTRSYAKIIPIESCMLDEKDSSGEILNSKTKRRLVAASAFGVALIALSSCSRNPACGSGACHFYDHWNLGCKWVVSIGDFLTCRACGLYNVCYESRCFGCLLHPEGVCGTFSACECTSCLWGYHDHLTAREDQRACMDTCIKACGFPEPQSYVVSNKVIDVFAAYDSLSRILLDLIR